jgi:lysozyme family protein
MTKNDALRVELFAAISVLIKRRANTTDASEKGLINDAIDDLNAKIQELDQANLLDAANIVASASDELEKVVASAKVGPFDTYLADIQDILTRLQNSLSQMHSMESLAPADAQTAAPLSNAEVTAAKPQGIAAPKVSTDYTELKAEYQAYFDACTTNPTREQNVDFYLSRINKSKDVYADVGNDLKIPWYFIGIIHGMECGFAFTEHLHNGDPLTARTVHVPIGRPVTGSPPFTWRESARDALILDGFNQETEWSIPRILYLLEKYNGFGYRKLGIPTPYLWSFSNLYTKGKFTSDGHFDPNAVSAQCGCALMLKALKAQGAL